VGVVLTLGFSLAGQSLLRVGVTRRLAQSGLAVDELFRRHLLELLFSPHIFGGFALSGIAAIAWIYVLAQYELSRALPLIGGLAYLALFAIGRFWLGERTTWVQLAGLGLLILGMYLVAQKPA
jgi:multidrug transporter EmrE-like cation transporter